MQKKIWNKHKEIEERIRNNNFKLCRYYSINNGISSHSIKNLDEGIVHFSKPSIFKDPFDSNLAAFKYDSFKNVKNTASEEKIKHLIIKNIKKVGERIWKTQWKHIIN